MLKLKSLTLIFIFIGMAACSSQNPNEVALGNGTTFRLEKNESKMLDPDERDVDGYQAIFKNHPSVQAPLYKTIYGEKYKIFIGIVVSISPETLFGLLSADTTAHFISSKKMSDTQFKFFAKQNGEYLTASLLQTQTGNKFIFSALGADSLTIRNFYEKNTLFQRLFEAP